MSVRVTLVSVLSSLFVLQSLRVHYIAHLSSVQLILGNIAIVWSYDKLHTQSCALCILCSNSLRSQLNRNFGKLYALQGKHTDALRHMAHDIYYLVRDVCMLAKSLFVPYAFNPGLIASTRYPPIYTVISTYKTHRALS